MSETTNERAEIEQAIKDSGDNITKAAERLGVARRTLQNRMRSLGIPEGKRGRRKMRISYRAKKNLYAAGAVGLAVLGVVAISRGRSSSGA